MARGKKKAWLLNTNSRRWKQLEFVLDKMEDNFTVNDMRNWFSFHWETDGQLGRHGKRRKMFDYHSNHISKFLRYHNNVVIVTKMQCGTNIYRHRRDKNGKNKTLP
tara:strand:+ start:26629 stop:26946 length:318 start_codon:yes stop_codon:yes gene_type:complete